MIDLGTFTHPYEFKGFGGCRSICDVTVWNSEDHAVVIFHEREDNQGTLVTNFSEYLATQIKKNFLFGFNPYNVLFFEHYHNDVEDNDTWDEITYDYSFGVYVSPKWKPSSKEEIMKLIVEWDHD
jgi:hypothetical protein